MTRRYAHPSHTDLPETAGHRPSQDELRAEQDARHRRRQRRAQAKTRTQDRPKGECPGCDRYMTIHARGLCGACYQRLRVYNPDGLADHPTRFNRDLDVDDVQVDRAVDWLYGYAALAPAERRQHRSSRPRLTQGERIEVLRRTRHAVPRWVAIEALGISGSYAARYLERASA